MYCNVAGRAVVNGKCGCSPTYYPTQTTCLPCMVNAVYNSSLQRCVCVSGYSMSNGACVRDVWCPYNSAWNSTLQRCVCKNQGMYVIDNVCRPCKLYSSWNGSACVCDSGYHNVSGICSKICTDGTWNGQICVCNPGYGFSGGVCKRCSPYAYYNNVQKKCVCHDGYWGDGVVCTICDSSCKTCSGPGNTNCTSCSSGSVSGGKCSSSCQPGTYPSNGHCVSCTANCILCYAAKTCDTCASGYKKHIVNSGNGVQVYCVQQPTSSATHVLTLRDAV